MILSPAPHLGLSNHVDDERVACDTYHRNKAFWWEEPRIEEAKACKSDALKAGLEDIGHILVL
jgi:hypothetical protein